MQATSKPKQWRKCVMDSLSAATAAELGEVSFQLPAEPLSATLATLLAASRELQRAGGPQLPPLARQCLAGELQVCMHPDTGLECTLAFMHVDAWMQICTSCAFRSGCVSARLRPLPHLAFPVAEGVLHVNLS